MLSVLTKCPEFGITEEEAGNLANAIQQVNALYDDAVVPAWVVAWANLVFVAGAVYGPRMVAYSNRRAQEKEAKAQVIHPVSLTPISRSPTTIDGGRTQ
jgi:hypothetical protein